MRIPERLDAVWAALAKRVGEEDSPEMFLEHVRAWLREDLYSLTSRMPELIRESPSLSALLEYPPQAFQLSEKGIAVLRSMLRLSARSQNPRGFVSSLKWPVMRAISASAGRCDVHCPGSLLISHCPSDDQLYLICDETFDRYTVDRKCSSRQGPLYPATIEQLRRLNWLRK
jgi:hypothetical protein